MSQEEQKAKLWAIQPAKKGADCTSANTTRKQARSVLISHLDDKEFDTDEFANFTPYYQVDDWEVEQELIEPDYRRCHKCSDSWILLAKLDPPWTEEQGKNDW